MPELVFVNKKTGRRYRAVSFDEPGGKVTLADDNGIEFTEPYSKERFKELGYTLQQA